MEEARLLVEHNMVKLCDIHNLDIQPGAVCVKCRLVTRTVGKHVMPEVIKLLREKAASTSDIPSAAERYAARLDEKSPTHTLRIRLGLGRVRVRSRENGSTQYVRGTH